MRSLELVIKLFKIYSFKWRFKIRHKYLWRMRNTFYCCVMIKRKNNDKCVSFCCLIGVLEHLSRVSYCQEIMVLCILFSNNVSGNIKTFQSVIQKNQISIWRIQNEMNQG